MLIIFIFYSFSSQSIVYDLSHLDPLVLFMIVSVSVSFSCFDYLSLIIFNNSSFSYKDVFVYYCFTTQKYFHHFYCCYFSHLYPYLAYH